MHTPEQNISHVRVREEAIRANMLRHMTYMVIRGELPICICASLWASSDVQDEGHTQRAEWSRHFGRLLQHRRSAKHWSMP